MLYLIGISKQIYTFVLVLSLIYSQNKNNDYFKNIDKLKFEEKLQKISILDSKTCIGNADSFFSKKELVLIEGNDGGELSEQNYKFYIKKGEIKKLNVIEYSNSKKLVNLKLFLITKIFYIKILKILKLLIQ